MSLQRPLLLGYHLTLAWAGVRRARLMSVLIVVGLSLSYATLAMALAMTAALNQPASAAPGLYAVQTGRSGVLPARSDDPMMKRYAGLAPVLMSFREAQTLLKSRIPTRQTATFCSEQLVQPPEQPEFHTRVRFCSADFFGLFNIPFQYGGPWQEPQGTGPQGSEPQGVVIDELSNRTLFGGQNSVGRTLRIQGRDFPITGVLAAYHPFPRLYDLRPYDTELQSLYLPFEAFQALHSRPDLRFQTAPHGLSFEALLTSQDVWIQLWVELTSPQKRAEYQALLASQFSTEAPGTQSRLYSVPEWQARVLLAPPHFRLMMLLSVVFLTGCYLSLVRLLLARFMAQSQELALRRALGASQKGLFVALLLEGLLLSLSGGLGGVFTGTLMAQLLSRLTPERAMPFTPSPFLGALLLGVALVCGLVFSAYPAWRVSRQPIAILGKR